MEEVKKSKYFSISVDSTPDISHVYQLLFVIRYVKINDEPVERSIGFIENIGHKTEPLPNEVFKILKQLDIYV